MNKAITEIIVTVDIYDDLGNIIRTESLTWDTENVEENHLSQKQIQDAVELLCHFFDVPSDLINNTKEKRKGNNNNAASATN